MLFYPRFNLQVIETEKESSSHWVLTDEGKAIVESGSHEALVYNAIPEGGIAQAEIMVSTKFSSPLLILQFLMLNLFYYFLINLLQRNELKLFILFML